MVRENIDAHQVTYMTYVVVWVMLLALLCVTIAVVKLNMLENYNVLASLFIASLKSLLVLFYFMHLKYEGRLVKGMLALAVGTLTLIIVLTFSDVWYR
jgi:cytochrome c oxidase subunit IV